MHGTATVRQYKTHAAGFVFGAIASGLGYAQAQAAVAVRPKLAEVGFVDAALTNHAHDWLFYHHPVIATALTLLVATLVIGSFIAPALGWS